MAALALGMLGIIFLTGQTDGSSRPASPGASPQAMDADRVRDFQQRLRVLDTQATADAQADSLGEPSSGRRSEEGAGGPPQMDPVMAERQRREYESLFASNVVLSRRPDAQRPDAGGGTRSPSIGTAHSGEPETSIDDVADAVVRATTRASRLLMPGQDAPQGVPAPAASTTSGNKPSLPATTAPISAAGPLHRVLEGTVIDTVLTNRLDGGAAAPVSCLVTNPVYSHSGQHVLIPAGARVLGETRPVQTFGETRLAVSFHRVLMPDGGTYGLDQFRGLNQIGDSGLRDRVNQHYWSTFGAAGAVGLVSGLTQLLGTAGIGRGDGDRTVIVAGGAANTTGQASAQVMNRFLNRLPTITIREGHRVKVYITSDLALPAYVHAGVAGQ
jgi:type IV secretion system protein VirB10